MMGPSIHGRRAGFALIAVLWVTAAIAAIGAIAVVDARHAIQTAHVRIDAMRGEWIVRGCLAHLRLGLEEDLAVAADEEDARAAWRTVDGRLSSYQSSDCLVTAEPLGASFSLDRIDGPTLSRYLLATGSGGDIPALVDAYLDWIDSDSNARPRGAERADYQARGRTGPRNSSPADTAELRLILGFEELPTSVLAGLAGRAGRICLNHAPQAVLAALPGFSPALAQQVVERRMRGSGLLTVTELEEIASPRDRDEVRAEMPILLSTVTVDPEGWIVRFATLSTAARTLARGEALLIRAGSRTDVLSWRVD